MEKVYRLIMWLITKITQYTYQNLYPQGFFRGKNNNDGVRVSGGTNGLGMKLTSNNSKHFVLQTVDTERKKYFSQESFNRLSDIKQVLRQ